MRIQDFFDVSRTLNNTEFELWSRLAMEDEAAFLAIQYLRHLDMASLDTLNKTAIHQAAFPGLPYRTQRFQKLINTLVALLKQAIGLQQLSISPELNNRLLLQWGMEKGLEELVNSTYQKLSHTRKKGSKPIQNNNMLDHLAASMEYYWWDLKIKNDLNQALTQTIIQLIENYISVQSLSLQLSISSLNQWKGVEAPFSFGEYLNRKLSEDSSLQTTDIQLLQSAIQLTHINTNEDFENFDKMLKRYGPSLNSHVRQLLHALKINWLIRAYNDDSTLKNMRVLLNAYKESIEMGLLMNKNILSYQTYLNIVTVAIGCGEWQWAKEFTERFKKNVPNDYRESAYAFNMGKITCQKGDPVESLNWLQQARLRDSNQFFAIKQVVIRNYYYMKDWKAINNVLNSLKIYALRKVKQDPSYHSIFRTNYVANIKRLLAIRLHHGDSKNIHLLTEIKQSNSTDHLWIIQEAEAAMG